MNRDEFWQIIDRARTGAEDVYDTAARLTAELARLEPDLIGQFLEHQARLMEQSYRWDLWGAAYVLHGGCSDDAFDYFRGWLVAQGKSVWDRSIADPDSLADVVSEEDIEEGETDIEGGQDIISAGVGAFKDLTGAYPKGPIVNLPELGECWDFDDEGEMRSRYPRLTTLFFDGSNDDE